VSVIRSLRTPPLHRIGSFVTVGLRARAILTGSPVDPGAIPGTIRAASGEAGGDVAKSITFLVPNGGPDKAMELDMLRGVRLVAFYVDERGYERVCGSPDYPLAFDFAPEGPAYSCRLDGTGPATDPYRLR
ncbi:MAG: hypothetical protein K2H87_05265, partial [Duncaniella sp.]|nr:hypothetical protein [Duncaniella sp.]